MVYLSVLFYLLFLIILSVSKTGRADRTLGVGGKIGRLVGKLMPDSWEAVPVSVDAVSLSAGAQSSCWSAPTQMSGQRAYSCHGAARCTSPVMDRSRWVAHPCLLTVTMTQ